MLAARVGSGGRRGAPPPPLAGDPGGPTPPGPKPDPPPIPASGLRALIVYETADLGKIPAAQASVLTAKSIRDYLNAKCPIGPDGKKREWAIWDKDTHISRNSSSFLKTAFQRKGASIPWIIISNGTSGFEGPLPADVTSTMTLLKKYGGE